MENNKVSYSSRWDGHDSACQCPWLQATLSDLNEKTKAMLVLIQEDGDSFVQRDEMYYKRRPELIKMVEEFHRSYRSLAERYDQLRSKPGSSLLVQSRFSSPSNSFKHMRTKESTRSSSTDAKLETSESRPESVVEDPDFEIRDHNQKEGRCEALLLDAKEVDEKVSGFGVDLNLVGDFPVDSFERESTSSELRFQVWKLMEDNLRQQEELIRRNDEKREAIKDLCFLVDRLMNENKALQNCLRCSEVGRKQNKSHISKLKRLIFGKLFRGDAP
ncbi:PREDICTED: protein NETWORKED 3A-like [Nelumbo nucifera]|uniref:Protein NETWORKED 3A-like n=2 Tax=Nelumbo nucifera TaxID=4432 RepID=A0A1U7ZPG5_NELNU|nr:PREDICTED: protein NETWORKED 3A-like [Nelumbo nucifera]DAD34114.1 TPA_asm: hypothetical protein HUJ06_004754 [Nelumbo nucifera]